MGEMVTKYQQLIHLGGSLLALIGITSFLWGSGLFLTNEASLIFACFVLAYACIYLQQDRWRPESLVIVAAASILLIAYVAQAILFLTNSGSNGTTLQEMISIRSIFSLAALGAGSVDIQQSLLVMLAGFVGVLLPAGYFSLAGRGKMKYRRGEEKLSKRYQLAVSNPFTVGSAAILCTIVFGILRKYFGLDSPSPSGLPMGVGGIINITSAYIGPNLLFAALFFTIDHGSDKKVKQMALLSIMLGVFNYILFTSKMSLIIPLLYMLLTQYLLGRHVVSIRIIALLGGAFVVAYPFLNLYRSAVALGIAPGELIATISDLYANPNHTGDIDKSTLQIAIAAIIGRFVGYDPLLILIQASPYPISLLEYIQYGDLDKYLTYEILDFDAGMGYSPGFLGRFFYISGSYTFVLAMTAVTVLVIAWLVRFFWHGDLRQQFMAPLLLTYCLIFFTDGIRYELVRSFVLSSLVIYGFIRITAKLRPVSSRSDGCSAETLPVKK